MEFPKGFFFQAVGCKGTRNSQILKLLKFNICYFFSGKRVRSVTVLDNKVFRIFDNFPSKNIVFVILIIPKVYSLNLEYKN